MKNFFVGGKKLKFDLFLFTFFFSFPFFGFMPDGFDLHPPRFVPLRRHSFFSRFLRKNFH